MHHPTDRITHTTAFVTPLVEHWLEREIAQWVHPMKDRSDDPSHHERTLWPRSYISLLCGNKAETVCLETSKCLVTARRVAPVCNLPMAGRWSWYYCVTYYGYSFVMRYESLLASLRLVSVMGVCKKKMQGGGGGQCYPEFDVWSVKTSFC